MLAEPAMSASASAEPLTGGEQAYPLEAITSQPSAAVPVGELSSSFDNNAAVPQESVAVSGMAAVLDVLLPDDGMIEEAVQQQLVTQSPVAAIATESAILASQAEGESKSPSSSQPAAAVTKAVSDVRLMPGAEPITDSVLSAAANEAADDQVATSHLHSIADTERSRSSPNLVAHEEDAVGLQAAEEHQQGGTVTEVKGSVAPELPAGEGEALVRCWSEMREEAEVAEAVAYAASLLAEADAAAAAGAALIAIRLQAEKAAIAVAATETVARLRAEKELAAMAAAEERRLHAEKVMVEAAAAARLQLEEAAAAAEAAAMARKAEEETAATLAAATARRQAEEEAATLAAADVPMGHHSSGHTYAHQPAHGDGYEAYALDLPMPDYGLFAGTTPLRVARSPTWQSSPVSGSAQITARTPSGDTVHLPAMVHWGASPDGGDSAFSPEAAAAAVGWVPLSGTAQVTALTASGSMVVLPAFVVVDARAVSRAVSASPPSGQRSSRTPGGSPGGYFGPYGLQGQVSPTSSQRQRGQYTPHSISPGGASGFRNNSPRKAGLTSHPILDADEWIEE